VSDLITSAGALIPLAAAVSMPSQENAAIWWILGLAGVAVMFNQVTQAWRSLTGRMVERPSGEDFQPKHECEQKMDSARREAKADMENLHSRINIVLREVSQVCGEIRGMGMRKGGHG
jgi:hypothetical protein